jgi:hypothetical protein
LSGSPLSAADFGNHPSFAVRQATTKTEAGNRNCFAAQCRAQSSQSRELKSLAAIEFAVKVF